MPSADLNVKLKLTDQLSKGLRKSETGIKGFISRTTKGLFSLRTAFIGLAAFGVGRLIKGVADSADSIGKLSDRIGVSTELLGKFRFAAQQSGADLGVVDKALETVTKRFGEFAEFGTGAGKDAIEALGLEKAVKDGQSFEDVLFDIVRALKQVESQTGKVAIITGLFGRSAGSLVNLFQTDPGELFKLFGQASTISREDARMAEDFNDAIGRLKETLRGLLTDVILPLLPLLEAAIDKLSNAAILAKAVQEFLGSGRDPSGGKAVAPGFVGPSRPEPILGQAFRDLLKKDLEEARRRPQTEEEARVRTNRPSKGFLPFPSAGRRRGGLTPTVGPFRQDFTQGLGNLGFEGIGTELTDTNEALAKQGELLHGIERGLIDVRTGFSTLALARRSISDISFALTDGISEGLSSILEGTKGVKEAFKDMAKSILRDLSRIIIQALIARAIGGLFGSIFGGGAGVAAAGASSSAAHGAFIRPGEMRQVNVHGGKFGEAIIPLQSRFGSQGGGGGGGTTIIYNIQAIDVEDFDNKVTASIARRDGEVSAIVAARSRNSGVLRGAFGIG